MTAIRVRSICASAPVAASTSLSKASAMTVFLAPKATRAAEERASLARAFAAIRLPLTLVRITETCAMAFQYVWRPQGD